MSLASILSIIAITRSLFKSLIKVAVPAELLAILRSFKLNPDRPNESIPSLKSFTVSVPDSNSRTKTSFPPLPVKTSSPLPP